MGKVRCKDCRHYSEEVIRTGLDTGYVEKKCLHPQNHYQQGPWDPINGGHKEGTYTWTPEGHNANGECSLFKRRLDVIVVVSAIVGAALGALLFSSGNENQMVTAACISGIVLPIIVVVIVRASE
jgi:hypothetical protein